MSLLLVGVDPTLERNAVKALKSNPATNCWPPLPGPNNPANLRTPSSTYVAKASMSLLLVGVNPTFTQNSVKALKSNPATNCWPPLPGPNNPANLRTPPSTYVAKASMSLLLVGVD